MRETKIYGTSLPRDAIRFFFNIKTMGITVKANSLEDTAKRNVKKAKRFLFFKKRIIVAKINVGPITYEVVESHESGTKWNEAVAYINDRISEISLGNFKVLNNSYIRKAFIM